MRNFYQNNSSIVLLKVKLVFLLFFILLAKLANGQIGEPKIRVQRLSTVKASGSEYDFKEQNINVPGSNLKFTIYNIGSATLNISGITLTGVNVDQFKLDKSETAISIAPGGTTTFILTFVPTSTYPEQKNAVLTINNNDSDEGAYIINLTGKAVISIPSINANGGIVPLAAEAGTDITINGSNLVNTEGVFFTGANGTEVAAASFTINTNNKIITARVPANAVTGPITVRNVSGSAVSTEVFTFLNTYTWIKTNGNWSDPNSWDPVRVTPATTDVLVFNGSNTVSTTTMTAVLDFASPQTISQIRLINAAQVTFTLAEDKTLYIGNNMSTDDFTTAASTKLTVTNSVAGADLNMELKQGETGIVAGNITFTGTDGGLTDHRLIANNGAANDESGTPTLTFSNVGSFTAGANFSGSPFGSTYNKSVLFASSASSGAFYYNQSLSGGSPFGTSGTRNVVVFEANATYRHDVNTLPDVINRTYGNFSIVSNTVNQTVMETGNLMIQRDLILNTPNSSASPVPTLNLNLVGTITIGRNITVTRGILNFNPASATIIRLTGSALTSKVITIGGAGPLTFGTNANLTIETGVTASLGTKVISGGGKVTINGTVRTTNANGISGGTNTTFVNMQPLVLNQGSTIDYNGTANQIITPIDYVNLTITGNRNVNTAITLPSPLRISGLFSPATGTTYISLNAITYNGIIEFNGGNQIIPSFNYYDVIISGTGDKVLGSDITINGTLNMVANNIDATDYFLILGNQATITGEAPGSYVIGKLSATRKIDENGSDFGGMGFILGSGAETGITTVTRIAGPNSSVRIEANNNEGINRRWVVVPENPLTSPVSVTLSWVENDDNGKNLTAMRVWKTEGEDESKFYDVSKDDQDASSRTITATISSFSTLTVSDQNNPLPVELISFDVVKKARNAVLTWQTATEKNNLGFAIEISSDAKNFQEIGFVKSFNSNSNTVQTYEFTHRAALSGTVYYRLKQTDWNNASHYYGPKAIHFDPLATIVVFPNPVNDKIAEVTVQAGRIAQEEVKITVTDALGKVVYRQIESKNTARNELKVNVRHLPAGVYVLTVSTPSNSSQTKIVKQ